VPAVQAPTQAVATAISFAERATEQRVPASQAQPGDLVFFVGADGTTTDPGHVGLVIGNGKMIEAYATGFPIRVSSYANAGAIGFTQPWANANGSPGTPGSPGASTAPPAGGVPTPGVTAQKGR
jgi:hypothetical protein